MVVGYHHYRKHPYWEFGKNYPTGTTPTSPLFLYPTFYRFTAPIQTKNPNIHPPRKHKFWKAPFLSETAPCSRTSKASHAPAMPVEAPSRFAPHNLRYNPPRPWRRQWYARLQWPVEKHPFGDGKIQVFPLKKWFGRCLSWNASWFFGGKLLIWKHKENNKKTDVFSFFRVSGLSFPSFPAASEEKSTWPGLSIRLIKWATAPLPSSWKATRQMDKQWWLANVSRNDSV